MLMGIFLYVGYGKSGEAEALVCTELFKYYKISVNFLLFQFFFCFRCEYDNCGAKNVINKIIANKIFITIILKLGRQKYKYLVTMFIKLNNK